MSAQPFENGSKLTVINAGLLTLSWRFIYLFIQTLVWVVVVGASCMLD